MDKRQTTRLKRNIKKAEDRVNKKIHKRIKELALDNDLIDLIDEEIDDFDTTQEYIKSINNKKEYW